MTSVCVSSPTISMILDLKSKGKLPHVKNLIMYDTPEEIHHTLTSNAGLELHTFADLVNEGSTLPDIKREEPEGDSILLLGVTSGTTAEPKCAMLTHVNFISG